jgi:hypothetical protein
MNNRDTRIRMAAESILENEALRDGLYDEQAASALLNWGVTWAEYLALQTAHIADDFEAEDEMYPQMKALRKLLVAVKDLAIAENWPLDALQQGLQTAFEQAQILNGAAWQAPEKIDDETWLVLQKGDSLARINNLRTLISGAPNTDAVETLQQEEKPVDMPAPEPPRATPQQEPPKRAPEQQDDQKPDDDGDDYFAKFFKPK